MIVGHQENVLMKKLELAQKTSDELIQVKLPQ